MFEVIIVTVMSIFPRLFSSSLYFTLWMRRENLETDVTRDEVEVTINYTRVDAFSYLTFLSCSQRLRTYFLLFYI